MTQYIDGRRLIEEDEVSAPMPWEHQAWETSTSYARFRDYYLSQTPPRSVVVAYNNWRAHEGLQSNVKRVWGGWTNWSQGRDYKGILIPGSLSWFARATAWDQYQDMLRAREMARQAQEEAEKWAKRRIDLAEKEFSVGEKLLDRALRMMNAVLFRTTTDVNGVPVLIEPTKWGESDIANTAKAGSELARRATGMPKVVVALDDWRDQMREIGADPEKILGLLVESVLNAAADNEVVEVEEGVWIEK